LLIEREERFAFGLAKRLANFYYHLPLWPLRPQQTDLIIAETIIEKPPKKIGKICSAGVVVTLSADRLKSTPASLLLANNFLDMLAKSQI